MYDAKSTAVCCSNSTIVYYELSREYGSGDTPIILSTVVLMSSDFLVIPHARHTNTAAVVRRVLKYSCSA